MCFSEMGIAENELSSDLWHKRLGKMSEKALQKLAKKFLILFAKGS